MPLDPRINNHIFNHETSSLEEKRKDTKIEKKKWKSNYVLGVIVILIIVSWFLSLIL